MPRSRFRILLGGFALVLASGLSASDALAQFAVYPANVDLVASDSIRSATVHVRNDAEESLDVLIGVEDFDQNATGDHGFLPLGSLPFSCGERIRAYPSELSIPSGEERTLRIEMDPGAEACWSVVWVENEARRVVQGASIGTRIGVKVYGTPDGFAPEGVIHGARFDTESSELVIHLENRGGAVMRPSGHVQLTGAEESRRIPIKTFSILPNHERHFGVALPKDLPAGEYTAMPVLDYGGEYVMATRVSITIP